MYAVVVDDVDVQGGGTAAWHVMGMGMCVAAGRGPRRWH